MVSRTLPKSQGQNLALKKQSAFQAHLGVGLEGLLDPASRQVIACRTRDV